MVPLVGHASELAAQREVIEEEIATVIEETGVEVTIPVGHDDRDPAGRARPPARSSSTPSSSRSAPTT